MKKLDTYWRIGEGVLVTTAATLDRKYGARLRAVVPRLLALDCITHLSLSAEQSTRVETLVPKRSDSLETDTLAALDAVHAAWNAAPEWIPWPTSLGFWWHRTRPGGAPHIVEACGGPDEFWVYPTGNECAICRHELQPGGSSAGRSRRGEALLSRGRRTPAPRRDHGPVAGRRAAARDRRARARAALDVGDAWAAVGAVAGAAVRVAPRGDASPAGTGSAAVRCAFCPAPAVCSREPTNVPPPSCWTHRQDAKAVYREVDALRGGRQLAWAGAWHRAVWALRDEVIARDEAEQRGEPAGTSGWTMFDAREVG